ncbi:uncharacterized protein MELLADRAFT_63991 [Melampsora larici-populina 98AG31]|uniref:Uncharacterized protein n=1 Tax=Melampsora larici-populina (strain 98AG31 / pathotype 3-4-7) TaxID=747676 RepID=F4RPR6_MELLP|nr:uncharacterized protein MELLADRAFT_63991 [Melampsora larici-populina 98AG31]EGG05690.1 hypothetical protein MELLADRAFT_63991 [Melampsora larici-populina 98AG31]
MHNQFTITHRGIANINPNNRLIEKIRKAHTALAMGNREAVHQKQLVKVQVEVKGEVAAKVRVKVKAKVGVEFELQFKLKVQIEVKVKVQVKLQNKVVLQVQVKAQSPRQNPSQNESQRQGHSFQVIVDLGFQVGVTGRISRKIEVNLIFSV